MSAKEINWRPVCKWILVVFTLVLLWPLYYSPTVKAYKPVTRYRLKIVYLTMEAIERQSHQRVGEQLRAHSEAGSLQERYARLMVQFLAKNGVSEKEARKSHCNDAFGNHFNVEFKTNLVALGASATLLAVNRDLVVWSSGKNGTNEFGNGDDIVWVPQDPDK